MKKYFKISALLFAVVALVCALSFVTSAETEESGHSFEVTFKDASGALKKVLVESDNLMDYLNDATLIAAGFKADAVGKWNQPANLYNKSNSQIQITKIKLNKSPSGEPLTYTDYVSVRNEAESKNVLMKFTTARGQNVVLDLNGNTFVEQTGWIIGNNQNAASGTHTTSLRVTDGNFIIKSSQLYQPIVGGSVIFDKVNLTTDSSVANQFLYDNSTYYLVFKDSEIEFQGGSKTVVDICWNTSASNKDEKSTTHNVIIDNTVFKMGEYSKMRSQNSASLPYTVNFYITSDSKLDVVASIFNADSYGTYNVYVEDGTKYNTLNIPGTKEFGTYCFESMDISYDAYGVPSDINLGKRIFSTSSRESSDEEFPYVFTYDKSITLVDVSVDGIVAAYEEGTVLTATTYYNTTLVYENGKFYKTGWSYAADGERVLSDITLRAGETYVFNKIEIKDETDQVSYAVFKPDGNVHAAYESAFLANTSFNGLSSEFNVEIYRDVYFGDASITFHNGFSGTVNLNGHTVYFITESGAAAKITMSGNNFNSSIVFKNGIITDKINGTVAKPSMDFGAGRDITFDGITFNVDEIEFSDKGVDTLVFKDTTINYTDKHSNILINAAWTNQYAITDPGYGGDGRRYVFDNFLVNATTTGDRLFQVAAHTGKDADLTVELKGNTSIQGFNYLVYEYGKGSSVDKDGTGVGKLHFCFHEGVKISTGNLKVVSGTARTTFTESYVSTNEEGKSVFFIRDGAMYVVTSNYDYTIETGGRTTAYYGNDLSAIFKSLPVTASSTVTVFRDMVMSASGNQTFNSSTDGITVTIDLNGHTVTNTDGRLYFGKYSGTNPFESTLVIKNGDFVHTKAAYHIINLILGSTLYLENVNYIQQTGVNTSSCFIEDSGCKDIIWRGGEANFIAAGSVISMTTLERPLAELHITERNFVFSNVKILGTTKLAYIRGFYTDYVDEATADVEIVDNLNISFTDGSVIGELDSNFITFGKYSNKNVTNRVWYLVGSFNLNFALDTEILSFKALPEKNEGVNGDTDYDYTFDINFYDDITLGDDGTVVEGKRLKYVYLDGTQIKTFSVRTSVTLYTDFALNIYIPSASGITSVLVNGAKHETTDSADGFDRLVIDGISPSRAADSINITLIYNSIYENTVSFSFSVIEYADRLLLSDSSYESKMLIKSAVEYIKSAYLYAQDSETLPEALSDILTKDVYTSVEYGQIPVTDSSTDTGNAGEAIAGASLELSTDFKLILRLNASYTGTLIVDGVEYTVENGLTGGSDAIVITLRAYELYLSDIEIKSLDGAIFGTYDLSQYIGKVAAESRESLRELLSSLYTYSYYSAEYNEYVKLNGKN